jgi:hypothetical protein
MIPGTTGTCIKKCVISNIGNVFIASDELRSGVKSYFISNDPTVLQRFKSLSQHLGTHLLQKLTIVKSCEENLFDNQTNQFLGYP